MNLCSSLGLLIYMPEISPVHNTKEKKNVRVTQMRANSTARRQIPLL